MTRKIKLHCTALLHNYYGKTELKIIARPQSINLEYQHSTRDALIQTNLTSLGVAYLVKNSKTGNISEEKNQQKSNIISRQLQY